MSDVQCNFFLNDARTNQKRLFEEAISFAKTGKVLYILQEELNELPDLSQDLTSVDKHYMKMISFLYTNNLISLIESISTLPDWQNIPCTIILEALDGYCGKNMQNSCGLVAMLIDAAHSCSSLLNIQTKLLISITQGKMSEEFYTILKELYCLHQ